MHDINSLLSSNVCLRIRAGLPFPHFGRLKLQICEALVEKVILNRGIILLANIYELFYCFVAARSISTTCESQTAG